MRKFATFLLLLPLTSVTAVEYKKNDARSLPETLSEKSNEVTGQVGPQTSKTGIINSSEITPDEINPSVNPAPSSDKELLESTTLTKKRVREGTFDPGAAPKEMTKEAMEEGPMDYSTTPEKKPSKKTKYMKETKEYKYREEGPKKR